jgi:hypothetical protein
MDIKGLKKELSKVSGIDFYNPKYRAIFKRFAEDDKPAETDEAEDAKATDTQTDAAVETKATEVAEDIQKDEAAETDGENPDYTETAKDETELEKAIEDDKESDKEVQAAETEADTDKPEPTAEEKRLDEITGENGDDSAEIERDGEGDSESDLDGSQSEVATEEEAAQPAADISDELLTTKLELELVRADIREDRLETAKRLFMPEFKASGGNTRQIRELIAQYPEWIGKQGGGVQGFGMPLGSADALTNEEKALKRLGIDPRS